MRREGRKHHDLQAWQKAMTLVKTIYSETSGFPAPETYGLASQMRRAAVSIPSNIAEGAARDGTKEFIQFLSYARVSYPLPLTPLSSLLTPHVVPSVCAVVSPAADKRAVKAVKGTY